MAQLRQDYQEFVAREAEVVVVGPEDREAFASYWEKEKIPFCSAGGFLDTGTREYDSSQEVRKSWQRNGAPSARNSSSTRF